jgi:hypothetical protein
MIQVFYIFDCFFDARRGSFTTTPVFVSFISAILLFFYVFFVCRMLLGRGNRGAAYFRGIFCLLFGFTPILPGTSYSSAGFALVFILGAVFPFRPFGFPIVSRH